MSAVTGAELVLLLPIQLRLTEACGLRPRVTSTRACLMPSQLVYTAESTYRTSLGMLARCIRIGGSAGT